jgi:hypothetical protein
MSCIFETYEVGLCLHELLCVAYTWPLGGEYKAHRTMHLKCTPLVRLFTDLNTAHGTYHCTAYLKYGSVQSAGDMNLSLSVKLPTEISASPDTVKNVINWWKQVICILMRGLISPKCTLWYSIKSRHIFLYCPEPVRLLLLGEHEWQLSQYSPLNF